MSDPRIGGERLDPTSQSVSDRQFSNSHGLRKYPVAYILPEASPRELRISSHADTKAPTLPSNHLTSLLAMAIFERGWPMLSDR